MTILGYEREKRTTPLKRLWENHAVWPRGPCVDSNPQACHSWCIQQILGVHRTPLAAGARGGREGVVAKDATQELKPSWVTSAVYHWKHTCLIFSPEVTISTSTFTSPSWKVSMNVYKDIRHMCVGTCRGITHEHTCKAEHMEAGGTGDRGSGWQLLSSIPSDPWPERRMWNAILLCTTETRHLLGFLKRKLHLKQYCLWTPKYFLLSSGLSK